MPRQCSSCERDSCHACCRSAMIGASKDRGHSSTRDLRRRCARQDRRTSGSRFQITLTRGPQPATPPRRATWRRPAVAAAHSGTAPARASAWRSGPRAVRAPSALHLRDLRHAAGLAKICLHTLCRFGIGGARPQQHDQGIVAFPPIHEMRHQRGADLVRLDVGQVREVADRSRPRRRTAGPCCRSTASPSTGRCWRPRRSRGWWPVRSPTRRTAPWPRPGSRPWFLSDDLRMPTSVGQQLLTYADTEAHSYANKRWQEALQKGKGS